MNIHKPNQIYPKHVQLTTRHQLTRVTPTTNLHHMHKSELLCTLNIHQNIPDFNISKHFF
jgi:hypothetical protein